MASIKTTKTDRTFDQFVDQLKKEGYKKLGRGSFALVMGKPGADTVIKISYNESDPWPVYAETIRKSKLSDNPWLPKVFSIKRFEDEFGDSYHVAEMERLRPLKSNRQSSQMVDTIEGMWNSVTNSNKMALAFIDRQFVAAVKLIDKVIDKHNDDYNEAWLDLHTGNIMRRGDQYVFTDPMAG